MKVFEFHFNPRKKDKILDSFCFEPEKVGEQKLGGLYMVGELKNLLPQNLKFLENLAQFIKKEYFGESQISPEDSFSMTLKKANEFLEKITKSENVSWLGNLNFAVLNIIWQRENYWQVNLAKVGSLKVFLLRKGEIIDVEQFLIGQKENLASYPLKIFDKVMSGKLIKDDRILILTKEALACFLEKDLLKKLAWAEAKEIKKFFKKNKKDFLEISGICFLIILKEKRRIKTLFRQKSDFMKSEIGTLSPLLRENLKTISLQIKKFALNKITILVLWLLLVLLLGFLIFRR